MKSRGSRGFRVVDDDVIEGRRVGVKVGQTVLGIFDKRTNRAGAITGMIVGLGFTTFYITAVKYFGMTPWLGISAEGIGTAGMLMNFAATLIVSRLTAPPPQEIQDMVESLRSPDHPGLAAILDEESVEFH